MTIDTAKLARLRAYLKRAIDLDGEATPGPWENRSTGMLIGNTKGNVFFVCDLRQHGYDQQDENNATFIALARNFTPQTARAMLIALDRVEFQSNYYDISTLTQILDQYPDL